MYLLAINTAQSACDLALLTGEGGIHLSREEMAKGQDARLPALVTALLEKEAIGLESLGRIAVCVGPGSFTGVRIGVAYARGLALGLGIPCLGVSALEACVSPQVSAPVRIALQAQKRPPDITFWTQLVGDKVRHEAEEWPLERLIAPGLQVLTDRPDLLATAEGTCAPSAEHIAHWAMSVDPTDFPPSPAYVRPPDAALPGGRPA